MNLSGIEKGDKVRVSRVVTVTDKSASGGFYSSQRYFTAKDWEVELVERPVKNWPPQVGDVWEAEGNDYVAEKSPYGLGMTVIETLQPVDKTGDLHAYSDAERYGSKIYVKSYDDFKALKPVLVRRRSKC